MTISRPGYSLVEVLAALFIVGLATGMVVLSIAPPPPPERDEARRFAARVALAAEEAVISGDTLGLRVTATGYRFLRLERGAWGAAPDEPAFLEAAWGEGVEARLATEDPFAPELPSAVSGRFSITPPPTPPPVRFEPTGVVTPFRLTVRGPSGEFVVTADGQGTVRWTEGGA